MPKIRYTKNELKAQRDALARYRRFLPTLQLKKQQLQVEIRQVEQALREKEQERERAWDALQPWVELFGEHQDFEAWLTVERVVLSDGNIAGVAIPVLDDVVFRRETPDLFATPPWVDDGIDALRQLTRLRLELDTLQEQADRLREELRTTNQRVNLFEKVKIPESRTIIRAIRIFMGDQQTAAVARSKIAKRKSAGKAGA